MADNSAEIERIRREIERTNSEMARVRQEDNERYNKEIARIRSEFDQSAIRQQREYVNRFKVLEKSVCEAHLNETNRMKRKYEALTERLSAYERELEEALDKVIRDNKSFLDQKKAESARELKSARESIDRLRLNIRDACRVPVDVFYPHAIQRYIDAGEEAERLLKEKLYSMAFAKADCACMSVQRLAADTECKVKELESMLQIYKLKIAAIDENMNLSETRQLVDDGEVIIELSPIDVDYWSDLLYTDLQVELEKHRDNVNNGVDGWLLKCQGSNISPSLLLDKEIQKLDLIPQKLKTCVSYALSACDCYNYLENIKDIADRILSEQNYSFSKKQFGAVKPQNDNTGGYSYYYDNYLVKEQCVDSAFRPDYREERVLVYKKDYSVGKTDTCRLYAVPVRHGNTVSLELYIQFDTDYLPMHVSKAISELFAGAGLQVRVLSNGEKVRIQNDRQLSLEVLDDLVPEKSEAELSAKYSLNI